MTTLVMVHNAHRAVTVHTLDRVAGTDDWTRESIIIGPGVLYQAWATSTRKIEVEEHEVRSEMATMGAAGVGGS